MSSALVFVILAVLGTFSPSNLSLPVLRYSFVRYFDDTISHVHQT